MFLSPEEIADLTGIKRGRDGKSRAQMQCDHLRAQGIPFFTNAAGDPKVTRSFFTGGRQVDTPARKTWQSAALRIS